MRKLFYFVGVLGLISLSSCMTEMQESQSEVNESLLREIGQSESYIKMTTSLFDAHNIYMSLDRDRFLAILQEAGVSTCEVKEKGIPAAMKEMEGAVDYLQLMMVYCEARDKFNETYPNFWNLPEEVRVRALTYRNEAIGFEPASVLAQH